MPDADVGTRRLAHRSILRHPASRMQLGARTPIPQHPGFRDETVTRRGLGSWNPESPPPMDASESPLAARLAAGEAEAFEAVYDRPRTRPLRLPPRPDAPSPPGGGSPPVGHAPPRPLEDPLAKGAQPPRLPLHDGAQRVAPRGRRAGARNRAHGGNDRPRRRSRRATWCTARRARAGCPPNGARSWASRSTTA